MKLIILLFFTGLALGIMFSLLRLRKINADKKIDSFECTVCDDHNCECKKKDE